MIERTEADWQALCAELGRLCGEVVTLRRLCAEALAELQAARALLASREGEG